jgi:crotonobetainyl-CoA:carnitine CoA-transferase CaiB-like acyl-CoA transferase
MADWGADVIKIEHPISGDAQRGMQQLGAFTIEGPVNPVMEHANRGKRSIGLDIANEAGRDILYDIARSSDVFLTNFLPATRRKLGIDVSDIQRVNPSIIYARGSAYGTLGADGEAGGYDLTGFWCRGGSAASATPSDLVGVISQPGPAYGDSIGAMTIAGGVAAALLARERTGEAKVVDISLLGVGVWAMGVAVNAALQTGEPWRSGPAGANVAPSNPLAGFYGTADGQYLAFSTLQAFRYWKSFCTLIGRGDLIEDRRFATSDLLTAHAADAAHEIRQTFARRPMAEWLTVLKEFDGQWTPVQSTLNVASDQKVRANGMVVPAFRPDGTSFDLVASPVQFDETAVSLKAAPEFAEHTEEILLELDRGWDEIMGLKLRAIVP